MRYTKLKNMFIKNKSLGLSGQIALFLSVILFIFINVSWGLSLLIGYACYVIYYYLLIYFIDLVLSLKITNRIHLYMISIVNKLVLVMPFILCLFIKYLNLYFIVLGLVLHKIVIYINVLLKNENCNL